MRILKIMVMMAMRLLLKQPHFNSIFFMSITGKLKKINIQLCDVFYTLFFTGHILGKDLFSCQMIS